MGFDDLTKVSGVIFAATAQTGGKVLLSQYFDDLVPESQRQTFEKDVIGRTEEDGLEVMQFDKYVVVFRVISDLVIIVFGGLNSNELFLENVIDVFEVALDLVFPGSKLSVQAIEERMENLYMTVDEVIEQGFVFCGDGEVVAARVLLQNDKAFEGKSTKPLTSFK